MRRKNQFIVNEMDKRALSRIGDAKAICGEWNSKFMTRNEWMARRKRLWVGDFLFFFYFIFPPDIQADVIPIRLTIIHCIHGYTVYPCHCKYEMNDKMPNCFNGMGNGIFGVVHSWPLIHWLNNSKWPNTWNLFHSIFKLQIANLCMK